MRALLLAAGLGTRLRPLTLRIPKCLVPVHGVPLLDIWLARIFGAGLERVVVNLHHLREPVRERIRGGPYRDRVDLFEEDVLLGTGGTLQAVRHMLGDGPVLVLHADNLSGLDIRAFRSAHARRPADCAMTLALFETDTPQSCGIVELDGQGRVRAFHEKVADPPGTLANAAAYIFEPEVLDWCERLLPPPVDLSTQVLPRFIGRMYSYRISGYHRDIGTPDALRQAEADLTPEDVAALLNGS